MTSREQTMPPLSGWIVLRLPDRHGEHCYLRADKIIGIVPITNDGRIAFRDIPEPLIMARLLFEGGLTYEGLISRDVLNGGGTIEVRVFDGFQGLAHYDLGTEVSRAVYNARAHRRNLGLRDD